MLLSVCALPISASAETEQSGEGFTYDPSSGKLTITTDDGFDAWSDYYYDVWEKDGEEEALALYAGVKELVVADGVKTVKSYAFDDKHSSLEKVTIAASVSTIGNSAFSWCPAIKNVTILSGNRLSLGDNVFSHCTALESITFPPSVTSVSNGCFSGCTSLKNVELLFDGRSMSYSIRQYAFSGCTSLESITLPAMPLSIDGKAFSGCTNLTDVTIPKIENNMGYFDQIVHNFTSDDSIDDGPFYNTNVNLAIHVPEEVEERFKTEFWPGYADLINPDENVKRYPLSLNGEVFSDSKLTVKCGDGTAVYNPEEKTLTLTNAEITKKARPYFGYTEYNDAAIYNAVNGLKIILIGNNKIVGQDIEAHREDDGEWVDFVRGMDGIESPVNLTLTGGGELDMSELTSQRSGMGFYIDGNLKLDDVKIKTCQRLTARGDSVVFKNAAINSTSVIEIHTYKEDYSGSCSITDSVINADGLSVTTADGSIKNSEVLLESSLSGGSTGGIFVNNSEITVKKGEKAWKNGVLNSFKLPYDCGFYMGEEFKIAPMNFVLDENTGIRIGNIDGYEWKITPLTDPWDITDAERLLKSQYNGHRYETLQFLYKVELFKDGERVKDLSSVNLKVPTPMDDSCVVNYYITDNGDGSTTYSVDDTISSQNGAVTTFATNKLDHIIVAFRDQEPEDYKINFKSVTPADAVVTLGTSTGETALYVEENGEYNTEISNTSDVTITVSADGYYDAVYKMNKGNKEDWELGDISLTKIPVTSLVRVKLSSGDNRTFTSFKNLGLTLKEGSKVLKEGEDYTLNFPNIVLSDSYRDTVSDDTVLALSVNPSESEKLTGASASTNLADAQFTVDLAPFGKAEISLSGVKQSSVAIYNTSGKLVESKTAEETFTSQGLKAGDYTVVAFEKNDYFQSFASLSALNSSGIKENADYVKTTLKISDNNTATASLMVPSYNPPSSSISLLNASQSRLNISPSNVQANKSFFLTNSFAFTDNMEKSGTLTINLPDDAVVEEIIFGDRLNPKRYELEKIYDKDSHTINLSFDNQSNGQLFAYMRVINSGSHTISASVSDGERSSVIGTKTFTAYSELKLTTPVSAAKSFTVTARTTAETPVQFSVKTNGSESKTVVNTNKAGTATANLTVPKDAVAGSKLIVEAYDGRITVEKKVNFIGTAQTTGILSLSFKTSGGERYIVSDGITPKKPYYDYAPSKKNDRWTITAKLSGPEKLLNTDTVSLIFKMNDGSFSYVPMTLTDSAGGTSGNSVYTFKGIYTQKDYETSPLPVSVRVVYADGVHAYPVNVDSEIDFGELMGDKDTDAAVAGYINNYESEIADIQSLEPVSELQKSDSYKALTAGQKSDVDKALGELETDSEDFDYSWMFSGSYKLSDDPDFKKLSSSERSDILKYEAEVEKAIETLSAALLLKKPLTEYKDELEALEELGIKITRNYTGSTSGFTRVDKNNFVKREDKKVTTINTKEKLRVETDYSKIGDRVDEVCDALNSSKTKASTGAAYGKNSSSAPPADVTVKVAAENNKNNDTVSKAELVNNLQNALGAELLGATLSYGKDQIQKSAEKLFENYVTSTLEEIGKGGTGEVATNNYIKNFKLLQNKQFVMTGMEALGHAVTAYGVGGRVADTMTLDGKCNGLDIDKARIDSINRIIENSNLSMEEKIKFNKDSWAYRTAIYELQMDYIDEETTHLGSAVLETWGSLAPIKGGNLLALGAEYKIFGADHIERVESMGSKEQTVEVYERLMMQWIQRAKDAGPKKEETKEDKETKNTVDEWVDEWEENHKGENENEYELDPTFINVEPIVDPSGVVYESVESNVLEGVTAEIWYSPNADGSGAVKWDAEDYDQINPQITGTGSGYKWDVPAGYWQVRFEKDGYKPSQTDWLEVPPPRIGLTTPMISTEAPRVETAAAYTDYVELTFSQYMDTSAELKTEGYTAEWINPEKNSDGGEYSKLLRLIPVENNNIGDSVEVKLCGAKNYAGTELNDYSETLTVKVRPAELKLNIDTSVITWLDNTVKVKPQVLDSDGKVMSGLDVECVCADDSFFEMTADDGFSFKGTDIGSSELVFRVKGMALEKTVGIVVYAEETAEVQSEAEAQKTEPAPTEPVTTEPVTEPTTEPVTTEPVTEPATDKPTEPEETEPTAPAKSAKLNKISASLNAGGTLTLKVTNGTVKSWKSSKKSVATVTNKGKVTALTKGSATITATLTNGKKLSCKVKVKTSPTIKIGKKKYSKKTVYTVKRNKTLTVNITGKAASVKNVYKTSNKKIAKITSKATAKKVKIKAYKKKGNATITLKVNGKAFKIKVKVV